MALWFANFYGYLLSIFNFSSYEIIDTATRILSQFEYAESNEINRMT